MDSVGVTRKRSWLAKYTPRSGGHNVKEKQSDNSDGELHVSTTGAPSYTSAGFTSSPTTATPAYSNPPIGVHFSHANSLPNPTVAKEPFSARRKWISKVTLSRPGSSNGKPTDLTVLLPTPLEGVDASLVSPKDIPHNPASASPQQKEVTLARSVTLPSETTIGPKRSWLEKYTRPRTSSGRQATNGDPAISKDYIVQEIPSSAGPGEQSFKSLDTPNDTTSTSPSHPIRAVTEGTSSEALPHNDLSYDVPSRKRNWLKKYGPRPASSGGRSGSSSEPFGHSGMGLRAAEQPSPLPTPLEGQELSLPPAPFTHPVPSTPSPTLSNAPASAESPSPATPKRWTFSPLLTSSKPLTPSQEPETHTLQVDALERTTSAQPSLNADNPRGSGSFSKMAFNSMMGGLSALSLSRTGTHASANGGEEARGRSLAVTRRIKSSSVVPAPDTDTERSRSRARSQSPFTFRRFRNREPSPAPQALPLGHSDAELSDSSSNHIRPRTAFADDPESGDDTAGETDAESDDEEWSNDDTFDPVTERNTERNAIIAPPAPVEGSFAGLDGDVDIDVEPDPLGEGVNVVVPPEPYFPSTLNSRSSGSIGGKRGPRRRKSTRPHEPLTLHTARPIFQRDRCTIVLTQGDPEGKLGDRRQRTYLVASDLSEESRYAVEWGIGTVIRDGDKLLVVTVVENEGKVDPQIPNAADRALKLRSQQERQGLAYILARQATSILQRTKLHVTVSCQAWHAKNAKRMLLDIVDHVEPTMMIVGSRGLGQLKGILLGSTSHYLIQKCAVPVMVARRRLKRPPRRSAHLSTQRVHISLAEAGIDRVAPKVDQDVKIMRDEIERDDERRDGGAGGSRGGRLIEEGDDDDMEGDDGEEYSPGVKVPG